MIGGKELRLIHDIVKELDRIKSLFNSMIMNNSYERYTELVNFDNADDLKIARDDLSKKFPERFYHFQSMLYGCEIKYSVKNGDYYLAVRNYSPKNLQVRDSTQSKLWRVKNGIINYGSFEDLDNAIHGFYDVCHEIIEKIVCKQFSLF